ncbi:MAG: hypothetical protein KatS3mg050_0934 [Litorilinea sp.]|nr:MAG: hypothetical protein KatS3mg050_0934 [Litorilinea sp.]
MDHRQSLITWLAMGVIALGIAAIVAITLQTPSAPVAVPTRPVPTKATLAAAPPAPLPADTPTATPTPPPTPTPLPPPRLPEVPPPAGGQIYLLTPVAPGYVGWVRSQDDKPNHFGDYNIYAGIFDGRVHVGAILFDLSAIPPGSPIVHADLTLTGLSDEWLGQGGTWSVQLLTRWMDGEWASRDFHWLSRDDSVAATLLFPLTPADLGRGRANTFFFPPETLPLLEARLYQGTVSLRVVGPEQGANNLFAWDSGFGAGSLGRPPLLRIVAGPAPATPPPSPTPDYVIITPPAWGDVLALAAATLTATAQEPPYTGSGTPTATPTATPLPPNWVTPVIVTNTPTPENAATAVYRAQVATAQAIVFGTPTPLPVNIWTATPSPGPSPTRDLIPFDELTATPTPTATPTGLPEVLRGKILFLSDRTGNEKGTLMVMNPDGSGVAVWTGGNAAWIYQQARAGQDLSPDGRYQVVVSNFQLDNVATNRLDSYQLFVVSLADGARPLRLTHDGSMNYDAVWSPRGDRIAFVSNGPGNDEIFTIRPDGSDLVRLTHNSWEWDKHPSWSPDGSQIVFWSNRETARRQIWIMNADGTGQRNLSNNEFNDWDPVWVK